jgi:hypothetical protein
MEKVMGKNNSFRFVDDDLNQQLRVLLRKSKVRHQVGQNGVIYYSPVEEEVIENDLICSVRDKAFPDWQVLTCPRDWTVTYEKYMRESEIPFQEELSNGDVWFLLPRKHRPHRWKLIGPSAPRPLPPTCSE